jgi:O-antigen ligase
MVEKRGGGGARIRLTVDAAAEFLGSARFASALATASIGTGILAWAIHNMIGWAGLIAILSILVVFAALSLWSRRAMLDRTALLPIALMAFLGWATLSTIWSQYQWATAGGLASLAVYTALGVYVALVRDTIQVIRTFGDVLRLVLVVSLALEVLSGVLIDSPIAFLGIDGHLAQGGPISGLVGNRNELGLLAVIGGITFVIEWRTLSIQRGLAVSSLILASTSLLLTRSPIAWGTALVAVAVLAILYGLRRAAPHRRRLLHFTVLGAAVVAAVGAWAMRSAIVEMLNGGGELNYRLGLWHELWALLKLHAVEGWGWIGQWNTEVEPYSSFGVGSDRLPTSAVNAYLDVWFQLGFIGFAIFLGLLGLTFVRSWLLAARQRTVVFTWPAVVLAALLTASLAESGILIEFGWMIFVICCVNASQTLSWRTALRRPLEQEPL